MAFLGAQRKPEIIPIEQTQAMQYIFKTDVVVMKSFFLLETALF